MSEQGISVSERTVRRTTGTAAPKTKPRGEPVPARIVQKKEFLDRVVAASGTGRSAARPIIDAVLEQLGEAIAAGETLAIPPFGKARVSRQRDVRGSEIITMRLRRRAASDSDDT